MKTMNVNGMKEKETDEDEAKEMNSEVDCIDTVTTHVGKSGLFVVFNEDPVDGRVRVTTDDE